MNNIDNLDHEAQIEQLTASLKKANESATTSNAKFADLHTKYTTLQKKHELYGIIDSFGKWKDRDAVRILIQDEFKMDEDGSLQTVNRRKPEEVLKAFSEEHSYLVAGNEANETGKSTTGGTGKHKLEDIFGPKSIGAKANKLANEDPALYKRMKAEAKKARLI